jgi:hypothetical protein
MKIKNQQADALKSSLTLHEFGAAMRQLDLKSVPKEKQTQAIMDHLMAIMSETVEDREAAYEIQASRLLRAKLNG